MFKFDFGDKNFNKIHFIGIGGISMSGIAMLLHTKGYQISGSDRKENPHVNNLIKEGIKIYIGQSKNNISDQDLFVYTDAIPQHNEELMAAKSTGKPVISRGVLLGALMRNFDRSIAVSGSHGKSTTTSMIAKILLSSNEDPTILLGGDLDEMEGNVKVGDSDILLTEACEFKANILNYYPSTAIVLNIDEDHLDYFKDLNHIVETFIGYMKNLDENSKAIINLDDPNTSRLFEHIKGKAISFSLEDNKADYYVKSYKLNELGHCEFVINIEGKDEVFNLNVAGKHNVYNALAAIITTYENGIDLGTIKKAISEYKTLHRRLETIGEKNGAIVITDYGHHPVEIKTTLDAIKTFSDRKIITIFEPHEFSRTKALLDDFSRAFYDSDLTIVTDIYPAREEFDPTIHSSHLVDKLTENGENAMYLSTFEDVVDYLNDKIDENYLVLTLGAGNTHILADMIVNS